jgi:hypothetical protein
LIEIPASVEIISKPASQCFSLNRVYFSANSHLTESVGFSHSMSLYWLEFLVSVEVINGFNYCFSLHEAIIPGRSRVRAIGEFWKTALRFLNIPPSVTSVWIQDFVTKRQ